MNKEISTKGRSMEIKDLIMKSAILTGSRISERGQVYGPMPYCTDVDEPVYQIGDYQFTESDIQEITTSVVPGRPPMIRLRSDAPERLMRIRSMPNPNDYHWLVPWCKRLIVKEIIGRIDFGKTIFDITKDQDERRRLCEALAASCVNNFEGW